MLTCLICNATLAGDAVFCSACGRPAGGQDRQTPFNQPGPEPSGRIHIFKDGQQLGPYSSEEIRSLLSSGRLHATDHAWKEGAPVWEPLSAMPEFNWTPSSPPSPFPTPVPSPVPRASFPASAPPIVFSGLPLYYQEEFGKILSSNESYKGKWNWAAFFFTMIWALTKGVWLAPLVWFMVFWAVVIFSCGAGYVLVPLLWILFGLRGNYMYYCASQKNSQVIV